MIEVGQTIKHSDEQVNTRKEMKTVPTQNASNAGNNTAQQNNKEWRKCTTLILLNNIRTHGEKDVQK